MAVRGLRGATTVESNTREEILAKTQELLEIMIKENSISVDDIASAIFSVTEDLNAEYPAVAARKIGWIYTPLFCAREIDVAKSLRRCIRVLLHINSDKKQDEMLHIYLYDAKKLRPDLNVPVIDKYYKSDKT
jgi:chorismate mutase